MNRERLETWFKTVPGSQLWERERALVTELVGDGFGHHAMEVGVPREAGSLLGGCCVGHKFRLSANARGTFKGAYRGQLESLAIRPRSLAVAVLVHVVDYHHAPGVVLAAVEQALVPGGTLVLTGFNPLSWLALRHTVGKAPEWWPRRPCGALRCAGWLEGLHLDVSARLYTTRWPDGLEPAGRRWPLGTAYVIAARKRERQARGIPLGATLRRRLTARGMPEPTSSRTLEDTAA